MNRFAPPAPSLRAGGHDPAKAPVRHPEVRKAAGDGHGPHDVRDEPRDPSGRWTDGGAAPMRRPSPPGPPMMSAGPPPRPGASQSRPPVQMQSRLWAGPVPVNPSGAPGRAGAGPSPGPPAGPAGGAPAVAAPRQPGRDRGAGPTYPHSGGFDPQHVPGLAGPYAGPPLMPGQPPPRIPEGEHAEILRAETRQAIANVDHAAPRPGDAARASVAAQIYLGHAREMRGPTAPDHEARAAQYCQQAAQLEAAAPPPVLVTRPLAPGNPANPPMPADTGEIEGNQRIRALRIARGQAVEGPEDLDRSLARWRAAIADLAAHNAEATGTDFAERRRKVGRYVREYSRETRYGEMEARRAAHFRTENWLRAGAPGRGPDRSHLEPEEATAWDLHDEAMSRQTDPQRSATPTASIRPWRDALRAYEAHIRTMTGSSAPDHRHLARDMRRRYDTAVIARDAARSGHPARQPSGQSALPQGGEPPVTQTP